jgi:hypothetical protein
LELDASECCALLLGLDDTGGFAINVEQIVSKAEAAFKRELPKRNAAGRVDVGLGKVANRPPGSAEQSVDFLPRLLFWLRRQDYVCSGIDDDGNRNMADA